MRGSCRSAGPERHRSGAAAATWRAQACHVARRLSRALRVFLDGCAKPSSAAGSRSSFRTAAVAFGACSQLRAEPGCARIGAPHVSRLQQTRRASRAGRRCGVWTARPVLRVGARLLQAMLRQPDRAVVPGCGAPRVGRPFRRLAYKGSLRSRYRQLAAPRLHLARVSDCPQQVALLSARHAAQRPGGRDQQLRRPEADS